jgi:hypothetical protein
MPPAEPILVALDRPRPVRWTARAQARNASLERPASFAALGRGKHRLYALCALLWASLTERDHEFAAPEDLAEFLTTEEQQLGALKVISALVAEAFPEKKSPPSAAPSPTGPSPSSTSASPPASTLGN